MRVQVRVRVKVRVRVRVGANPKPKPKPKPEPNPEQVLDVRRDVTTVVVDGLPQTESLAEVRVRVRLGWGLGFRV